MEEFRALLLATKWTYNAEDQGTYATLNEETLASDKSNAILFFPCAGQGNQGELISAESGCYYWTSSLKDIEGNAYYMQLSKWYGSGLESSMNAERYHGYSIRPVSD